MLKQLQRAQRKTSRTPLQAMIDERVKAKKDYDKKIKREGSKTTEDYREAYVDAYIDVLQDKFSQPQSKQLSSSSSSSSVLVNSSSDATMLVLQKLTNQAQLDKRSNGTFDALDSRETKIDASFGCWRNPPQRMTEVRNHLLVGKYNIVHQSMLPEQQRRDGGCVAHPSVLKRRVVNKLNANEWQEWHRFIRAAAAKGTRYRGDALPTDALGLASSSTASGVSRAKKIRSLICRECARPAEALCVVINDVARYVGWAAALDVFTTCREVVGDGTELHEANVNELVVASLLESIRVYRPWRGAPPPFVLGQVMYKVMNDPTDRGGNLPVAASLVPMWIDLHRPTRRESGRSSSSMSWIRALSIVDKALIAPQRVQGQDGGGKMRAVYLPVMGWEALMTLIGECGAPRRVVQTLLDKITIEDEPLQKQQHQSTARSFPEADGGIIVSRQSAVRHMKHARVWNGYIRGVSSSGADEVDSSWRHALELLEVNMREHLVTPTADTYAAVGESLLAAGRWEQCLAVLRSLSAREGKLIPRCASTYCAMFNAFGLGGQWRAAVSLLMSPLLPADFCASEVVPAQPSFLSAASFRGSSRHRGGADDLHVRLYCNWLHDECDVPPAVLSAARRAVIDDPQRPRHSAVQSSLNDHEDDPLDSAFGLVDDL